MLESKLFLHSSLRLFMLFLDSIGDFNETYIAFVNALFLSCHDDDDDDHNNNNNNDIDIDINIDNNNEY